MTKRFKVLLVIFLLLISTGCTSYMQDENKKAIINEETGQSLTSNILCKPTDEKLLTVYEENKDQMKVQLEDLPECEDYKPSDLEYSSLWETILIKPIAWLILKVGYLVHNMGISVMLLGLLIRLLMLPLSIKSTKQSANMKKATPAIKKIEKKYENKTDSESMMAKSQETMMIYKKYGINPVSGCIVAFIQLPLFFAFLEAINRVPAIFEGSFLGMNLGTTPIKGIFQNHQYIYIALIILIIATTYLSFKKSMNSAGDAAAKQMSFMIKFMLLMIAVASLSLSTAIGLYWIVTNAFAVIQTIIIQKVIDKEKDPEVEDYVSPREIAIKKNKVTETKIKTTKDAKTSKKAKK